jgi:hypothetical protein
MKALTRPPAHAALIMANAKPSGRPPVSNAAGGGGGGNRLPVQREPAATFSTT